MQRPHMRPSTPRADSGGPRGVGLAPREARLTFPYGRRHVRPGPTWRRPHVGSAARGVGRAWGQPGPTCGQHARVRILALELTGTGFEPGRAGPTRGQADPTCGRPHVRPTARWRRAARAIAGPTCGLWGRTCGKNLPHSALASQTLLASCLLDSLLACPPACLLASFLACSLASLPPFVCPFVASLPQSLFWFVAFELPHVLLVSVRCDSFEVRVLNH